jgi:hypothetical protein
MFQTVLLLAMSLSVEAPAAESPNWTEVIGQWIGARLAKPANSNPAAETSAEEAAASDENAAPTPEAATTPDTAAVDESANLTKHSAKDEPLEAIDESRPDDLDEFADAASRFEKSVDAEELTEATGGLLSDDGEIDWTTQAD